MSTDPKRPRYWHCLIGPIPDDQIPFGGDSPPRIAAIKAVSQMTQCKIECASGWIEESEAHAIEKAWSDSYMKAHGISS